MSAREARAVTLKTGTRAPSLRDIGAYFRALSGWRRVVAAMAAGMVSTLAFAPFDLFFFLLLAFGVLVLLIDSSAAEPRPIRATVLVGWAFGFGQFLAGLYWVGYAFTVDASAHAWQIPFVAVLFPGGLALFPALAASAAAALWRDDDARIFVFAACFGAAEWLRGHALTGFPWNLAAYGWAGVLPVLQSAALVGAYGLSLLTILFGASLALPLSEKAHWRAPAAMAALFALAALGGAVRLALVHPGNVPGVTLRLVQPNVAEADKYLPELRWRNWNELIALSQSRATVRPNIIVWPEAAPPFLLSRSPEALDEIGALAGKGRVLMTGAVRVAHSADGKFQYFNSFYIFGPNGRLLATYDKFHLVPFGEYLPLSDLLSALGFSQVVESPGGFSSGDGPHTYALPNAPPVGPLICYEIIFPGAVLASPRPDWLVNVSDDSWFGISTGPHQHLLTARVRAIEEGLPVARDTNTGVSAVIDPLGRLKASLGLEITGFLDSALPQALAPPLYARIGDSAFGVLVIAFFAYGAFGAGSKKRGK